MKTISIFLLTLAMPLLSAFAQQASAPTQTPSKILRSMGSPIEVSSLPLKGMYLPVRCDAVGTIYFRNYVNAGEPPQITSISADGLVVRSFDVSAIPGLRAATMSDFSMSGTDLIMLPNNRDGSPSAMVEFSGSGDVKKVIKVEDGSWIAHGAQFGDEKWLLVGLAKPSGSNAKGTPQFGVYSSDGKQVKAVPGKSTALPTPNRSGSYRDASGQPIADDEAKVYFADAEPGPGGTVYLLEPVTLPRIRMFSSDGKVLQTFDLSPPEEGMRPVQMFFDGADLVVDFVKNTDQGSDQNSFEIIDAFTGTRKSVYRTPDLSGTLACVDHGKFTFLLSSRGHATLQHAFE